MKKTMLTCIVFLAGLQLMSGFPVSNNPIDGLMNESRLSNEQLRSYFEHNDQNTAAERIDLDGNGIVDFMDIEVWEFLARMELILYMEKPFEYKIDAQGNRIESASKLDIVPESHDI